MKVLAGALFASWRLMLRTEIIEPLAERLDSSRFFRDKDVDVVQKSRSGNCILKFVSGLSHFYLTSCGDKSPHTDD